MSPFSEYVHLPAFTGWGYSKDLPRFAGKTFRQRFRDMQGEGDSKKQVNTQTGKQVPVDEANRHQNFRDQDELVSQFTQELTKVNGNIIRTTPNRVNQSTH